MLFSYIVFFKIKSNGRLLFLYVPSKAKDRLWNIRKHSYTIHIYLYPEVLFKFCLEATTYLISLKTESRYYCTDNKFPIPQNVNRQPILMVDIPPERNLRLMTIIITEKLSHSLKPNHYTIVQSTHPLFNQKG